MTAYESIYKIVKSDRSLDYFSETINSNDNVRRHLLILRHFL